MNSDAYELIKATEKLPSPKGVALEILRLTEEDSTTVEALGVVIESDPALASKLLKIVNSPLSGATRKVASLARAAVLLGFRTVASLALGLSLVTDNQKGGCAAFNYDAYWSESLGRAVAARHLAKLVKLSPDEAFTCALLSHIGRLAFAGAYPDRYAQALSVVGGDAGDLCEFEREMFGIDHNALSAEMMADWHLPQLFSDAALSQENPDSGLLESGSAPHTLARVLHLGSHVAVILTSETVDHEQLSAMTNKAFGLGIRPDQIQEAFDSIRDEWRDTGKIFAIETRNVPTLAEIHSRCTKRRSDLAEAG